jgi:phenylalanyl-tRNA synthetase beta chain
MKISYSWLKKYLNFSQSPEELSVLLTDCGLEVEALDVFESIPGGLKGVVTGLVVNRDKHPNADKLSVTKVDAGTGKLLDIVCGAPNVAIGQKVMVALTGTELNGPKGKIIIQKSKIRGEVSEGMICAEDELGVGTSHEGIMVLPADTPIGLPASQYFNMETDFVFEIGLTPNRPDAASHIGVARDIAAVINCRNYSLGKDPVSINWPDVSSFSQDNDLMPISVEVENAADCPRYSGVTLTGVAVKESPAWLQNKLKAIGLRPLNNIVDITNYVLFETGQPLHAFDADRIGGRTVAVKKLQEGTAFTTLDEADRKLTSGDLMICDNYGPMCMAGIFGGTGSGITDSTNKVFLESACFNPVTIRKSSRHHGLKTDASFRFERGTDPGLTIYALKRAALLIKEIAGGTISSSIVDFYPHPIHRKKVNFHFDRFYKLAGKNIDRKIIYNIFNSLDIGIVSEENGNAILSIPTNKVDVTREADVAEEILRIYGYNNIETSDRLNISLVKREKPDADHIRNVVSDYLASCGFYEIMSNSLTREEYYQKPDCFDQNSIVKALNPLSRDLSMLRQTLLYGMLEAVGFNKNRKNNDLRFFEFGKTYFKEKNGASFSENYRAGLLVCGKIMPEIWHSPREDASFFYLKSVCENIILRCGLGGFEWSIGDAKHPLLESYIHGIASEKSIIRCGRVSMEICNMFGIRDEIYYADADWDNILALTGSKTVAYHEIPRHPEVRRDLALIIAAGVGYSEIEKAAFEAAPSLLKSVSLFDVYQGDKIPEGKSSYALSFFLRDDSKTMTDAEIDKTMEKISNNIRIKTGAVVRDGK